MWQAAAAVGGSLLSTAADIYNTNQTNNMNRDMTREQMRFQDRMSSTAHQREVRDLKAAGLNPILSAGGSGASTPGGANFTAQKPDIPDLGAQISNARGSSATVENTKANTALTSENINVAKSQDAKNKADAIKSAAETIRTSQEASNASILGEKLKNETRKGKIDADYYDANKHWLPAANAITPLVGQGIGAATNALTLPNLLRGIFTPKLNSETTTRSHYGNQGEHSGTIETTKRRHK